MKASSLELLERTPLPTAQARAILEAMDAELATDGAILATKTDLAEIRHGLELKIESLRSELIHWNFAFWIAQLAAVAGLLKLMK